MNRIESERLLLDHVDETYRDDDAPVSAVHELPVPRHLETAYRDRPPDPHGCADAAPPYVDIAPLLPEWDELSPVETVRAASEQFSRSPSHESALLLQSTMNRIYAHGELASAERKAVDEATELLSRKDSDNPQTDNIYYTLHQHADFHGMASFNSMTPGWGYWRQPSFRQMGMNDIFSSLSYGASADEVGGAVLLFEHERYFGRYRAYIPQPGARSAVPFVGRDFNDLTSSALIVRRFAKETPPVALGSLVDKREITEIVDHASRVSSRGEPVFTWDMWPTGGTSSDYHPNDVGSTFVYVIVPITVHTPWPWADYQAQARYWIRLFVDRSGRMQGYVAYWGYWVEKGLIAGDVADGLRDAIPKTVPQVDEKIARAVSLANIRGPFSYVYYLPGRFQLAGNVADDVTIVAVRQ